ncbi:MAG: hypothetical protein FWE32_04640 [Oscillospiraceae bacterium]|nr:hypothetical protein [Oscillospiraceae bacterium]
MKKITVMLLVLALAFGVVGCAANQAAPPPVPPAVDYEPDYIEEDDEETPHIAVGDRFETHEFEDENLSVSVFYTRPMHTHEHIVVLIAEITNIGEDTVVYQIGSGSNRVPDALTVELGPLTALFKPVIQTMDMQHGTLEPGESVTFSLPFAPFTHESGEEQLIGFDRDIAFFEEDEEWQPVPIGEYIGNIRFEYLVRGEGEDWFFIVEGDELFSVGGDFQFLLFADEVWPEMPAEELDYDQEDNGEEA